MSPDNMNTTENPNESDEITYFHGSPALRGSLGAVILCTLLGVGLIAGSVMLRSHGAWIPLAGFLVAAALIVFPVIEIRTVRYRISNYRIDFERGVFSKDIDTLELWHVEDIKFHQSFMDRILRIGTITVISHDETTPSLSIRAIPDPRPIFETLKQRVIVVKRQRGVIKLDAG